MGAPRAVRRHLGRRRRRCVSVLVDLPKHRGLAPQLELPSAGSRPSGPFKIKNSTVKLIMFIDASGTSASPPDHLLEEASWRMGPIRDYRIFVTVFNLNSIIDRSFTTRPLSGQPGGHHNATGTSSAACSPNPIAGIWEVPPNPSLPYTCPSDSVFLFKWHFYLSEQLSGCSCALFQRRSGWQSLRRK